MKLSVKQSIYRPAYQAVAAALLLLIASAANADLMSRARALQANDMAALGLVELFERRDELTGQSAVEVAMLKAGLERDSGLYMDARETYTRLVNHPDLAPALNTQELVTILSWATEQEFAELQERAAYLLSRSEKDSPEKLLQLALYAMATGKPEEATELLASRSFKRRHNAFIKYNRAVALMQSGKVYEGRQELEAILDIRPRNEVEYDLYDQIRLALGFHYLSYNQGSDALRHLRKVDSAGKRAEKALLGLGWAELSPGGYDPLCRSAGASRVCWITLDDNGEEIHSSQASITQTFDDLRELIAKGKNPTELKRRVVRALAAWQQIPATAPFTEVRQEAMVARAYALSVVAPESAMGFYRHTTNVLTEEQERLRATEWTAQRDQGSVIPPNAPANRQQVWTLRQQLSERAEQVVVIADNAERIHQRIAFNADAYRTRISEFAATYLARDTERTSQYLRQSRQGLALQLERLLQNLE